VQYDLIARQLSVDRGFTLQPQAPYEPTPYREPLYPLLVAAFYRVTNTNVDAVMVLQAVLLGLSAGLTAVIPARLIGPLLGLVAGALFGLNSEVAHYDNLLLTEVLFTFVILLTIAARCVGSSDENASMGLLMGVTLGPGVLVRTIDGVPVVPLLIGVALTDRRREGRYALLNVASWFLD
jgi:4-amino-4-deoxy-L-arabinose transferase-like glycosyltransferase